MKNRLQRLFARAFGGKSNLSVETLKKWNIAAGLLLAAQAGAVLLFSGTYTVPLYMLHMTGDALQSKLQGVTVVAPAVHPLWQVNVAYVAAAVLFMTASSYLVVATLWQPAYEVWTKRGVQPLRWVMAAASGGLLAATVGLLGGLANLVDLKLLVIFAVLASLSGAWWELRPPARNRRLDAGSWLVYAITAVVIAVPLLEIVFSMVGSIVFGNVVVPGYIWWLYATVAAGWLLFVGNALLVRRKTGKWSNYLYGEAWYVGVTLLVETLVVWELFAAVLHP